MTSLSSIASWKPVKAYPGLNNLFPVKNGAGKTIRLVVVSAGYVMAFDVKHSFIPQVP